VVGVANVPFTQHLSSMVPTVDKICNVLRVIATTHHSFRRSHGSINHRGMVHAGGDLRFKRCRKQLIAERNMIDASGRTTLGYCYKQLRQSPPPPFSERGVKQY
jgi:hypothetical protein